MVCGWCGPSVGGMCEWCVGGPSVGGVWVVRLWVVYEWCVGGPSVGGL